MPDSAVEGGERLPMKQSTSSRVARCQPRPLLADGIGHVIEFLVLADEEDALIR
jgi:hypothetical protein